jgi:hypothetical protein
MKYWRVHDIEKLMAQLQELGFFDNSTDSDVVDMPDFLGFPHSSW